MNTDGTGEQRLTYSDLDDFWPSWSPDGTKVAASSVKNMELPLKTGILKVGRATVRTAV